jgi:hypothetical protein
MLPDRSKRSNRMNFYQPVGYTRRAAGSSAVVFRTNANSNDVCCFIGVLYSHSKAAGVHLRYDSVLMTLLSKTGGGRILVHLPFT